MIEVSMTEIALLVWAGLATAAAFHYRAKEDVADRKSTRLNSSHT